MFCILSTLSFSLRCSLTSSQNQDVSLGPAIPGFVFRVLSASGIASIMFHFSQVSLMSSFSSNDLYCIFSLSRFWYNSLVDMSHNDSTFIFSSGVLDFVFFYDFVSFSFFQEVVLWSLPILAESRVHLSSV